MSDVSVLSHEYNSVSEFSDGFNRALIALKKAALHVEQPAPERLTDVRLTLAEILEALASNLDQAESVERAGERPIPRGLVQRLRTERRGDLAYVIEDLRRTARVLRDGATPPGPRELALLDQVSALADAVTSTLFRRLMRV